MNREQMIAWLTLEGWRYHEEDDEFHPVMSNGEIGYLLHLRHGSFPWKAAHAQHKTGDWDNAPDEHLRMAMLNLGVAHD